MTTPEQRQTERERGSRAFRSQRHYEDYAPIVVELLRMAETAVDGVHDQLIAEHAQDGVDIGAHTADAYPTYRLKPNPAGGYDLEVTVAVLIEDKSAIDQPRGSETE